MKKEKKSPGKFFKILASIVLLLLIALTLPALVVGITQPRASVGSYLVITVSTVVLVFFWSPKLREKVKASTLTNRIYKTVCVLLAVGSVCFAGLSCMIVYGMTKAPPTENTTVVVLGCQVHGTYPSLMLQKRLNAALTYLREHPDAPCIVSGGQGQGEDIPEAQAMYNYLVDNGIPPARIYKEETSINTFENMANSAAIIRAHNFPETVVVVTDGYHQYRSHLKASENGLTPYSVNADTPWWLFMGSFSREVLALAKTLVFGG